MSFSRDIFLLNSSLIIINPFLKKKRMLFFHSSLAEGYSLKWMRNCSLWGGQTRDATNNQTRGYHEASLCSLYSHYWGIWCCSSRGGFGLFDVDEVVGSWCCRMKLLTETWVYVWWECGGWGPLLCMRWGLGDREWWWHYENISSLILAIFWSPDLVFCSDCSRLQDLYLPT